MFFSNKYGFMNTINIRIHVTHLCDLYPLVPHFYIVKLGLIGIYIIFLLLLLNIDCTNDLYFGQTKENIIFFYSLEKLLYITLAYFGNDYFRDLSCIAGERQYQCSICESWFALKQQLRNHMLRHTAKRMFQCDQCDKKYVFNCDLEKHKITHSDIKPFQCHFCDLKFKRKGEMKKHIKTHTNERPHTCDVCMTSFAEIAYLRTHMRIHTGEEPFKCEQCPRGFKQGTDLKKHVQLVHEKPGSSTCDICNMMFATKYAFSRHLKTHT